MSIKVMAYVWEYSKQTGTDLLMLLAIADHSNDAGACWPSLDRLASRCRVSLRQAKHIIKKLEDDGELSIERGVGRGHTSTYTVKGVENFTFSLKGVTDNTIYAAVKGDTDNTFSQEKVKSSAIKGEVQRQRLNNDARAEPLEPSLKRDTTTRARTSEKKSGATKEPKAHASRFAPATFVVTDALRSWAAETVPGVNIDYETGKFLDWEFKDPRTDWVKTWRGWMRRAWEKLPADERRPKTATPRTPRLVL